MNRLEQKRIKALIKESKKYIEESEELQYKLKILFNID